MRIVCLAHKSHKCQTLFTWKKKKKLGSIAQFIVHLTAVRYLHYELRYWSQFVFFFFFFFSQFFESHLSPITSIEVDHEINSMVILHLQLVQEGQLSVTGEKYVHKYWSTTGD